MKKGFTLIELLAVIVILAIIALIATPIVLNIIDDSKKSATLRSADFYLDAVEISIANSRLKGQKIIDVTYNILESGNICLSYDTNNKCTEELEVEVSGETPKEGTITIQEGEILYADINLGNDRLIQNSDGEVVNFPCELIEKVGNQAINRGDKYLCKVDPKKEAYTFYVLAKESDGTTSLILDRNICEDGSLTSPDKEDKCNTVWNSTGKSSDGPVDAMNHLYNATKDWSNVPNIQVDYTDSTETDTYGYSKIITEGNKTKIIKKDGTTAIVLGNKTEYENLKSRMPIYDEFGCSSAIGSCSYWLVDHLSTNTALDPEDKNKIESIEGISNYWSLSSVGYGYFEDYVWTMFYDAFTGEDMPNGGSVGVRPVINIKL